MLARRRPWLARNFSGSRLSEDLARNRRRQSKIGRGAAEVTNRSPRTRLAATSRDRRGGVARQRCHGPAHARARRRKIPRLASHRWRRPGFADLEALGKVATGRRRAGVPGCSAKSKPTPRTKTEPKSG